MDRLHIRTLSLTGVFLAVFLAAGATGKLRAQPALPPPPPAVLEAARAAFEALPEAERKAIQDGLIWSGDYSGVADGTFGRQTFNAIAALQAGVRKPVTGILSPSDRKALQDGAQQAKTTTGFALVTDPRTGVQLGVPSKILTKQDVNPSGGSRWQSADSKVTLDTRLAPPDATLQSLYDRNIAIQTPGRVVTYKVLRPDFFVITGETPTGKFYTRYASGPQGIRAFSIGYDKSLSLPFDRLVVAIANSFTPFPTTAAAPTVATTPSPTAPVQQAGMQGSKLIGTGLVFGPRRVITTAPVESCKDLRAQGLKPQSVKGKGAFVLEFAEDLKAKPIAISEAAMEESMSLLVIAFSDDNGSPNLAATPGQAQNQSSLTAPLQPGASGAPVVTMQGALAGFVSPVSSDQRKIAGILPTARHAVVPLSEVRKAAPDFTGKAEQSAPQKLHAADIVGSVRNALVPIMCGP